jgi:hypothetical protein
MENLNLFKVYHAWSLLHACRLGSFVVKYENFATKNCLRHHTTPHVVRGRKRRVRGEGWDRPTRPNGAAALPAAVRQSTANDTHRLTMGPGLLSSLCVPLCHRFGTALRKALRFNWSRDRSVATVTNVRKTNKMHTLP